MLEHFQRPIILAHRGDSAHAPENTLPAFSQAIQEGADGIELDVKLTADGHVVVIHDSDIERTTNGNGRVASMTLDAIRKLDAGSWFDPKFKGTQVPLLEEAFETIGRDKLINIELKNYSTPFNGLAQRVCELIKRHNNGNQIILSSFFAFNLNIAAQILPDVSRGLLALRGAPGLWARSFGFMFGDFQALHPHISSVSRQQVARAHRVNRRVHVWTVNAPEDVSRMMEWGVDGIITDDPAAALKALGRSK